MQVLRYVLRNITPLNLILIAGLAALAVFIYPTLTRRAAIDVPSPGKETATAKNELTIPPLQDLSDYSIVGELNIFHPDRKPPPPEEEEPEQVQPPPAVVEFTLYGTLVSEDVTLAFVEEKSTARRTAGRRKSISILKVGDTIAGYTLKRIEADKIVLVRGEEEVTVQLYNAPASSERNIPTRQPARQLPRPRRR